jgi:DNA-binding response OmpR family regulator
MEYPMGPAANPVFSSTILLRHLHILTKFEIQKNEIHFKIIAAKMRDHELQQAPQSLNRFVRLMGYPFKAENIKLSLASTPLPRHMFAFHTSREGIITASILKTKNLTLLKDEQKTHPFIQTLKTILENQRNQPWKQTLAPAGTNTTTKPAAIMKPPTLQPSDNPAPKPTNPSIIGTTLLPDILGDQTPSLFKPANAMPESKPPALPQPGQNEHNTKTPELETTGTIKANTASSGTGNGTDANNNTNHEAFEFNGAQIQPATKEIKFPNGDKARLKNNHWKLILHFNKNRNTPCTYETLLQLIEGKEKQKLFQQIFGLKNLYKANRLDFPIYCQREKDCYIFIDQSKAAGTPGTTSTDDTPSTKPPTTVIPASENIAPKSTSSTQHPTPPVKPTQKECNIMEPKLETTEIIKRNDHNTGSNGTNATGANDSTTPIPCDPFEFNGTLILPASKKIKFPNGTAAKLSSKQLAILTYFNRKPNKLRTHETLLQLIEGKEKQEIRQQISNLRKLYQTNGLYLHIYNEKGEGYILKDQPKTHETPGTTGTEDAHTTCTNLPAPKISPPENTEANPTPALQPPPPPAQPPRTGDNIRLSETETPRNTSSKPETNDTAFEFDGALILPASKEIKFPNGTLAKLSSKQLAILTYFNRKPNKLRTHKTLQAAIFKRRQKKLEFTIGSHIHPLKKQYQANGCNLNIHSVFGKGYTFKRPPQTTATNTDATGTPATQPPTSEPPAPASAPPPAPASANPAPSSDLPPKATGETDTKTNGKDAEAHAPTDTPAHKQPDTPVPLPSETDNEPEMDKEPFEFAGAQVIPGRQKIKFPNGKTFKLESIETDILSYLHKKTYMGVTLNDIIHALQNRHASPMHSINKHLQKIQELFKNNNLDSAITITHTTHENKYVYYSPATTQADGKTGNTDPFEFHGAKITAARLEIKFPNGKESKLEPKEADILAYFNKNRNKTCDYKMITCNIWGDRNIKTKTIDNYISHIKNLFHDNGLELSPVLSRTTDNTGYIFHPELPDPTITTSTGNTPDTGQNQTNKTQEEKPRTDKLENQNSQNTKQDIKNLKPEENQNFTNNQNKPLYKKFWETMFGPKIFLDDWDESRSGKTDRQGYTEHQFDKLAATNLIPNGTQVQLRTGKIAEISRDKGFYEKNRLAATDGTQFPVAEVIAAQIRHTTPPLKCLPERETDFLNECRKAGIAPMPLELTRDNPLCIIELTPEKETEAVKTRLTSLHKLRNNPNNTHGQTKALGKIITLEENRIKKLMEKILARLPMETNH